jgi:hypothetical protein
MAGITFVVYDPPAAGLPYLTVAIAPDSQVSAVAYQTAHEAELHNSRSVVEAAKDARARNDRPREFGSRSFVTLQLRFPPRVSLRSGLNTHSTLRFRAMSPLGQKRRSDCLLTTSDLPR